MKNFKTILQAITFILFAVIFTQCKNQNSTGMNNPLLRKSNLQYQAPEFDKIKDADFKPAFDSSLKLHDLEIEKIAKDTTAPTFANTVMALELSGQDLSRVSNIFYNLTGANTNETIQKIEQEYAPILSAHFDKIYLNSKIYNRIKALKLDTLKGEDKRLTEYYINNFEMAGAALSDASKDSLMKINSQLAVLSTEFQNKLLKARKNASVLIDNVKDLDGLTDEEIKAAALNAKEAKQEGKYLLALLNTTQQPLLKSLKNRDVREKLFKASWTRAEKGDSTDTKENIMMQAKLRLQKAKLLGKQNFAEWKLQDQMAKNPTAAINLLLAIAKPALAKAKKEAAELQAIIDKQNGGFKLQPWDWDFYSEQVRKEKYNLEESQIKPYFEVNSVLENGIFYAAKKMYGITFKVRKDLPGFNPDVIAYEVFDKNGESIALYYLDFYARNNKRGGAWMSNFVNQSKSLNQKPVIVNVFNYQKPSPGNPSLISWDDVTTMFHEFGHTLHGLFANQIYPSISGTAVPRDFVEFPSQFNEHFALDNDVLKNYAVHYKTKQPIPQELLDKVKASALFNNGYAISELLEAALIDMAWHTITNPSQISTTDKFETDALTKYNVLFAEVPPRYHSTYFNHIFGGEYCAGYYAYTWAKTIDLNVFDWMKNNGGLVEKNGDMLRKEFLSVGNSVDLNAAFEKLVGHKLNVESYLTNEGLK